MRKILIGLGTVLLLSFLVSIYNYLTFKSPAQKIPTAQWVEISMDTDAALARLTQALQYKTISHKADMRDDEAFEGFLSWARTSFPLVFEKAQVDTFNRHTLSLYIKGNEIDWDPVVFLAHYDVVPVEFSTWDQWDAEPFSGEIKDGYLYGRGTLDNKGAVFAQLEALEALLTRGFKPKRDFYLCLLHDEEIGGQEGAVALVQYMKERGIKPHIVLDEGGFLVEGLVPGMSGPVALVGTAEKGYLSVDIKVRGSGGHSSMPVRGNTIAKLADVVQKIEKNPFPFETTEPIEGFFDYAGPEMQWLPKWALANRRLMQPLIYKFFGNTHTGSALLKTTQVPTIIQSGMRDNVVPNLGKVTYNFRLLPGYDRERVINHLTQVIGDSSVIITINEGAPYEKGSAISPHQSEVFEALASSIKAQLKGAIVSPYLVLAATDARHFTALSEHVYRFSPFRLGPEDLGRIHGINERVEVASYLKGIEFYAQAISDLCND